MPQREIRRLHRGFVKCVLLFLERDAFDGEGIEYHGIRLECPAFRKFEAGVIRRIAVFVMTSGENPGETDREKLLFSVGSCEMLAVARSELQSDLAEKDREVSDILGPGYYGMPLEEAEKIADMTGAQEIGVNGSGAGTLKPAGTCSGLFFIGENLPEMDSACRSCLGKTQGCRLCAWGGI